MTTTNINIRTDSETKTRAQQIFTTLGLDMTTAVNLFLRQTVRMNDIPFVLSTKTAQTDSIAELAYGRGCVKGKMRMADDFNMPLDMHIQEKPDTWGELDRIVSEMEEKPRFEDFPRCKLGHKAINFEEV